MDAIKLEHVSRSYEAFALQDVSLTLPEGCILGLLGENGAGKTTLIRLILDLIRCDSGTVTLLGESGGTAPVTREGLGVVLDEGCLPPMLNAYELGRVLAGIYKTWDESAWRHWLERFDLPQGTAFSKLSKGMKMKLAIAVALSHHPKLLVLDEATAGLDPMVRDDLLGVLTEFTRDEHHSVLISSHIVSDLEKICDYVAFLHQGRLLLCEEKDALLDRHCLLQTTPDRLAELEEDAVLQAEQTPYGVTAVAVRDQLPEGCAFAPVSLEQLFVAMIRKEERREGSAL